MSDLETSVPERKYTPVTLLLRETSADGEETRREAASGACVFDGEESYLVSVVLAKPDLRRVTVRYTCAELINGDQVKWINVPVEGLRVRAVDGPELEAFFAASRGEPEGPRRRYALVCRLPAFCTVPVRNGLRPFAVAGGTRSRALPRAVRIESSPFALTTVEVFGGYTSHGHVNYASPGGEFWLSDCKFMENMNGGVVVLEGGDGDGDGDGLAGESENRSIGLVWGRVRWKAGELMVVLGWGALFGRLGLFAGARPTAAAAARTGVSRAAQKVVALRVTDRHGVLSWGSGVVVERGTVVTNKHVVTGSCARNELPATVEIVYTPAGGTPATATALIAAPQLGTDVHMSLATDDAQHDVCFVRTTDPAFCAAVDAVDVLGGGPLAALARCRAPPAGTVRPGLRVGDRTVSVGHGLFLAPGAPLQSAGRVSKLAGATVICSSPCWAGCSGGAVLNAAGELVALMAHNVRHVASGETLAGVNCAIGVAVLSACHDRLLVAPRQRLRRSSGPARGVACPRL